MGSNPVGATSFHSKFLDNDVLTKYPADVEIWALLGRVDKDAWTESWRRTDRTAEQMREDATYEDALLRAAIDSYAKGYRTKPGHHY
jgi:hypothetical protein